MASRKDTTHFGRELVVLTIIFAASTSLFAMAVYPAIGWPSNAPMPGRSVILALAILVLVSMQGGGLHSIGLARPRYIWLTILLAILFIAAKLFAVQPAVDWVKETFSAPPSDTSFFETIEGNLPAYLGWLATAWIAGGFAEEIIFRGYLINRIAASAGSNFLSWTIAIFAQAILFGLGHYYQGLGGVLGVGLGAVFSGAVYVLVRRNLWVLVLAHGAWDSLGLTLIYLSGAPSTS